VVDAGKVVPEVPQHVVAQEADDQSWDAALQQAACRVEVEGRAD